jgi:HK97 family phage portal protein
LPIKNIFKIFKKRSSASNDEFLLGDDVAVSNTKSSVHVTNESAMAHWAVFSCISIISDAISSLSIDIIKSKDGYIKKDTSHHLNYILNVKPNNLMTALPFLQALTMNVLNTGDSYSEIYRNRSNQILGLIPIESSKVQKKVVNGELFFMYTDSKGRDIRLTQEEVLFIPGYTFDGVNTMSVIEKYARDTIGNGIALTDFLGYYFSNGVNVGGALEHPGRLRNKETFTRELKKKYSGLSNSRAPMILEDGMSFKQFDVRLVDAQFIETEKLNAVKICGIFKVPPHKIGLIENTNLSNIEEQNKDWLQNLLPWIIRIEQGMTGSLFTESEIAEGYKVRFDVDSLLRGNLKERARYYKDRFHIGSMSPNDIRRKENENPIEDPGGDDYYVPANMYPIRRVDEIGIKNEVDNQLKQEGEATDEDEERD